VVAPSPWHVQLWLVDVDYSFYDQAATATRDEPTSVRVLPNDTEESIATLKLFPPKAAAMLTDLAEARHLIRTELNVKTSDSEQLMYGLVDYAATLDFVSEDFIRRFALQTSESHSKTPFRHANGQRVVSSIICDIAFDLVRHEFQRIFYLLRNIRVVDLVLGLPWLDDEHTSLQFGTTRSILMDGIAVETQIEERRHECLILSSAKI
jgi:hypothetical protein